jgi:putative transposase
MAGKRDKPEEIVAKLRQAEVLPGQGMTVADAIRRIGVSEVTYYRWRKQYGDLAAQAAEGALERENQRLRKAVSDRTLDKLILQEAAKGNS